MKGYQPDGKTQRDIKGTVEWDARRKPQTGEMRTEFVPESTTADLATRSTRTASAT